MASLYGKATTTYFFWGVASACAVKVVTPQPHQVTGTLSGQIPAQVTSTTVQPPTPDRTLLYRECVGAALSVLVLH